MYDRGYDLIPEIETCTICGNDLEPNDAMECSDCSRGPFCDPCFEEHLTQCEYEGVGATQG